MSDYIEPYQLYYSEIFPSGIYAHYKNDSVELPIPDSLGGKSTPIVTNILTHELFYCKKLNVDSDVKKKLLVTEILNPSTVPASWPVDLVHVDADSSNGSDYSNPSVMRHLYCDEHHAVKESDFNYVLLFPYERGSQSDRGGYAYYVSLDNWLKSIPLDQRNFKNDKIKKVCRSICACLAELNAEGYLYFDFSLSRFMVDAKLNVTIEYSNLLMSKSLHHPSNKGLTAKYGFIPLDFIEPYLYFKFNNLENGSNPQRQADQNPAFSAETQNYSLSAMLFYLLLGRKPYEGHRLMQNQDNEEDLVLHYAYLRNYYLKEENINFIFDNSQPNDNLLVDDYMDFYSKDIELWQACPAEIREMFIAALHRQQALRESGDGAPAPKVWLDVFKRLNWGV